MRFFVTAKDMREGRRQDCTRCPVVRAVRRRIKAKFVSACVDWVSIDRRHYRTPPRAALFIYRFDEGRAVKPFSFTLPIKAKPRKKVRR